MNKMFINESEKERIKKLYESVGIILLEDNLFGLIARRALSFIGKNEDDIARLFQTTESAVLKNLDDVVGAAMKAKNVNELEQLQARLMHVFNPSGMAENVVEAQQKVKNFLNGYAKAKGRSNFKQMKDEITNPPKQNAQQPSQNAQQSSPKNDDWAEIKTKQPGTTYGTSWFSGKRISNRTIDAFLDSNSKYKINWADIKNKGNGKTPEEWAAYYNKLISQAIKTGDYQYISSKGFESVGISNFREFLKNNIQKVNEVVPETGRWSVNFK
jgi:hypothetical protein